MEHYGSPAAALAAAGKGWPARPGLRPETATRIPAADAPDVARCAAALENCGAWLLSYWDSAYPELLRCIPDPPALLYGRGTWPTGDALAMVGSRQPTPSGAEIAYDLARQLAGAGIVIVSGLARGIDAAAHRGSLAAGGRTLAVLGCGIDRVYPSEHKQLFRQILEQGAVLSEYPPGTPPMPGHFPGRNRIISGLARGVLLVEATLDSGSLITADYALEQGRDVMAVPGNIRQPTSAGTNQLIKQGAQPITAAEDVLQLLWPGHKPLPAGRDTAAPASALSESARRILDLLDTTPRHIDRLLKESGLTPMALSDILLHLELQGYAEQLPGTHYIRNETASSPHSNQGSSLERTGSGDRQLHRPIFP